MLCYRINTSVNLIINCTYFVEIRKKQFIYQILHGVRQEELNKTAEEPIKYSR